MTNYRNMVVRILQVIWFLGFICFLCLGLFILFLMVSNGDSTENILGGVFMICGCALAFIILMLSIQYILFGSFNINDLFDGSLMQ